ncbi:succinoglycan biosynthesis transport protein ExoP [Arthrobacter sp. CG_A4]|nr:succinoglycan biosynthesis transport protein ExoP [Arthrobacter sp. CG_A4]
MGVPLELAEYGRAMVRGWWIVLLCMVVGFAAAAFFTARTPPVYQSSVRFYVVSAQGPGQSALQALELSRGRIAGFAGLAKSDKFADVLGRNSNTGLSAREISESISATGDQATLMLSVVVSLPDQARALAVARTIVDNLGTAVSEVEAARTASGSGQTVLNLVGGPTVETVPVSPHVGLNLALGTLLGFGAGVVIAVSRRLMDKTLGTAEQVEEASGRPLLARIPLSADARKASRILEQRQVSLLDEAGRRLRTNIDHLPGMSASGVVAITSARVGDGKSSVALLLAQAWAEAGERVLLVEGDLRTPRLAAELALANGLGLADLLAGRTSLADVIQPTVMESLQVVAAGAVPANPTELLRGPAAGSVLAEMRTKYSRVIVDAPAMQPYSDAALLAAKADCTVVVVMHRRVTPELLKAAFRNLELVNSKIAGVVLNALPARLSEAYKQPSEGFRTQEQTTDWAPLEMPAEPPVPHAAPRR